MQTNRFISSTLWKKKNKSVRWMPWHLKAMKDVASCEKLRVGASNLRSEDVRMGQPTPVYWGIRKEVNAEN